VAGLGEEALSQRLRMGSPAVMARLRDGALVLDVRTVFGHQEGVLIERIGAAVEETE